MGDLGDNRVSGYGIIGVWYEILSKTVKHKRQHYVPRSYLRAWCDPDCPPGHTPYVWVFSKSGGQARRKSPGKIFRETDMYTVHTEDGQRDLTLETNLSRTEEAFSKLRREKLDKRLPLSSAERLRLCTFAAAAHGRTRAYAAHWSNQWEKVLEIGSKMEQAFENASEEQRAQMSIASRTPPGTEARGHMTMEEVRRIVQQPVQSTLSVTVVAEAPLLFETPFVILETSTAPGFITSDAPCVWFDPARSRLPPGSGAGGLVSPTIEITLPLSPKQMLMFGNRPWMRGQYLPVPDEDLVNGLNKRTRLHAHEHFVSSREKPRAAWFSKVARSEKSREAAPGEPPSTVRR